MDESKTAVVTGGNTGIGKGIVLALAERGWRVVIDYVADPDEANAVAERAKQAGGDATCIEADVSQVDGLRRLINGAVDTYGRLDAMINNAGVESRHGLLDTGESEYDKVLAINLKGAFFGSQLAAKQMIQQGPGGVIVNISSVHEERPMPGNIAYCCSKGGMRMLTRTAAVELAGHGIRVVGVGPGAVATPINKETMQDPQELNQLRNSIPLGKVAQPEQIAALVAWLVSDAADYVTGTTYFVDGGLLQASAGL
jgi:glucose 1-dehydrogenase